MLESNGIGRGRTARAGKYIAGESKKGCRDRRIGWYKEIADKTRRAGKSGGGRVIYLDVLVKEKIYLLFAYPKNVQEDLTSEQRRLLRRMAEAIMEE